MWRHHWRMSSLAPWDCSDLVHWPSWHVTLPVSRWPGHLLEAFSSGSDESIAWCEASGRHRVRGKHCIHSAVMAPSCHHLSPDSLARQNTKIYTLLFHIILEYLSYLVKMKARIFCNLNEIPKFRDCFCVSWLCTVSVGVGVVIPSGIPF